ITPDDEVIETAERAARALDIPFCGVDILDDGARILVNEVNARPTVDNYGKYEGKFYDVLARVVKGAK
ncbi:MAG: alpha-L-glutamate ligase, partial [Halobacteria archaeon]|nr:alpha-L-glutamate ligase [Halobacteria archaeon]